MKRQSKIAQQSYLNKINRAREGATVNPYETPIQQKQNIENAKKDVIACVNRYFPHYATSPSADFHIRFAKKVKKEQNIKAFAQWGRGLAKSVWCDVIIPFWLWMNGETNYIVLIGQERTKAGQLLDDLQAELEANQQIIHDFGELKIEGKWESGRWQTKSCPRWNLKPLRAIALGMGQEVRGLRIGNQRPDLCIVDDIETRNINNNPKRQDQFANWIETALIPTMDGNIRRLLYANNRFAQRMVQTILQEKHPNWWVHHIPAYDKTTLKPRWNEKYKEDYYKNLITELGIIVVEQEYLQKPVIEGKIFKPEQIIWDKMPRMNNFKIIVGHWDIAYAGTEKSDYNAVRIWGLDKNNIFWYIQSFVKQTKMAAAVHYICQVQKQLPSTVIIHWQYESQFWNDEVDRTIHDVETIHELSLNIRKIDTPRTKKFDRMLTMQPRYQNNRIRYNKKMKADNDTQTGLAQLYGLEPGYRTHDDAPDADEQCIAFLEKYISFGNKKNTIESGRMEPNHERI